MTITRSSDLSFIMLAVTVAGNSALAADADNGERLARRWCSSCMSTVQDIAAYARWSDQVIRGDVFKYKSRLNLTGLFFVIGSAAQKTRAH
jgi:hypothetical protein